MDATSMTGWWTCSGCGIDAELPATDTAGCTVPCPDCAGSMMVWWEWEVAVGRATPLRPESEHCASAA